MVKDFIVKTLYNVGDSFATGVGLSEPKLDSYPAKISQSFDSKLVSLARPGCCNFSISLMIDWLARDGTTNPNESFYLISTTNENRLHWLAPLQTLPAGEEIRIEDLNYDSHKENLLTELPFLTTNKIQSETCSNVLLYNEQDIFGNKSFARETKDRMKLIGRYITELHDIELKRREDVNALLLSLHRLNKKTQAWCIVTPWHEIANEFPDNVLSDVDFGKLSAEFPDDIGSGHFNRTGHRRVARSFETWYTKRFTI